MPSRAGRTTSALALSALLVVAGCGSDDDGDGGAAESDATTTTAPGAAAVADLPDDWPPELALPDGVAVVSSTGVATQRTVVATIDGDVEAVYDTLVAQLTEAGHEIVGQTFTETADGGYGSISARGEEITVAVAFGPDPTGDVNQVTISVAAVDG